MTFENSKMVSIDYLIIETTRKCNMSCSHCLRGDAQRKSLDFDKLQDFLTNVSYIGTITIGGGEPTLAKKELEQLLYFLQCSHVNVGNLFVVTNGKRMPNWFLDWYIEFINCVCTENDISSLAFSFDKWHTDELNNEQIRKRFSHYHYANEYIFQRTGKEQVHKHSDETWKDSKIIAMGRAEEWGDHFLTPEKITIENNSIQETNLYFSVDGLLFSECNLSYKEMNRKSKFFITDSETLKSESLISEIEKYNKTIQL